MSEKNCKQDYEECAKFKDCYCLDMPSRPLPQNQIPWPERVNMLSINPDAATIDDIAQMAAELIEYMDKEIKNND